MALVGTLPLILGGNKMPLTVEDFEKTKEVYQYKDYQIELYKKFNKDYWVSYIKKEDEVVSRIEGYHDEEIALSDAKRVIRDKEKPKFKRGDILKFNNNRTIIAICSKAKDEKIYNIMYFSNQFTTFWDFNYIDENCKK